MNYPEQSNQNILPQFSEISTQRTNVTTSNYASSDDNQLRAPQSTIYTTAATNAISSNNAKQTIINSQNKNSNTNSIWSDPSTAALMQFCEKQGIQGLQIPSYGQNNAVLGVQTHSLPMRIIPNVYSPQIDQVDKNDAIQLKNGNGSTNCNLVNSQTLQQPIFAEYLQKLQSSSSSLHPLSLQQFLMIQPDHIKKEKASDQKNEQTQNSILNIPNVPTYKNSQLQNDSQFMRNDHTLITLNPSDVNVHMDDQPESAQQGSSHIQSQSIKRESTMNSEAPKAGKKIKFRAKTGEIKMTVALDGSPLYCCPDCNLAFSQKSEIDEHLQIHIMERKYQCKECGAMLKRKEHLDQHMRGHSNERPFKCPICQKAFKRNEHLTRHYVIHSGDKNFTCQICQKSFSRKDHLNKHSQTHLGIKKPKPKKEAVDTPSGSNSQDHVRLMHQDINIILKEHIQSLQKDPSLMQTFSAFKDHVIKDGSAQPHQAVNMNDILPQNNTRYLMPS